MIAVPGDLSNVTWNDYTVRASVEYLSRKCGFASGLRNCRELFAALE
jgi:hypothetical protein